MFSNHKDMFKNLVRNMRQGLVHWEDQEGSGGEGGGRGDRDGEYM